ncbi:MAG: alanine--tRNA ligase [Gammaproteobacteria bacterium CG11_big_fil_rev_8_21_14_0_20_46_22]|nr:MAG: alanine--tRNA ligase [Gammaproteobacteria bacterium CG12_big_fil_rev_8_21_14_0_65_46_12]PIR10896.1 MAG: alanine--tRNA ligase [Gammaproteobacteria bacterium CG11_big_fil_rev_8_21_14_0_20_46_22]
MIAAFLTNIDRVFFVKQHLSAQKIREQFTAYFEQSGHTSVASSSLIPANDPTLLFVNAGMVQFKEVFLGHEARPYTRATSIQRCVRAGGKHNDLENVGFTARHHTFFEMLGNFSFGDYFKHDAIRLAWGFLTETLGIPEEKLWVTVYDKDDETADIWLKDMKISPERFSRCGEKDNFWSMGDTGPCGPCTEIFYDHGEDVAGGPPGSPDEDGDRYVEIWNLVFMQFNRDEKGELTPLPKPSVDTGMGLERIAAVMQGVHTNYETDEFRLLIADAAKLAKIDDHKQHSLKVIADHIRSTSFLILDGVRPSNEGRGYVLRRIIRRAIRHGHKLGIRENFFHKMVQSLCDAMGKAYPELLEKQAVIEQTLKIEEQQFAETLDKGLKVLEGDLKDLKAGGAIAGDVVFKLYDTYGFPLDLTNDIAREKGYTVDEKGFEACMQAQRERSQSASHFKASRDRFDVDQASEFVGYDSLSSDSHITHLFKDGKAVKAAVAGDEIVLTLQKTPFYAESGGQAGDTGFLYADEKARVIRVHDTQKQGETILHFAYIEAGEFKAGDRVLAEVDRQKRQAMRLNHSATHLLHAALRKVLGEHVVQKGSLVTHERLRFDFSHHEAMSHEQLRHVERVVNDHIRANHLIETHETDAQSAKDMGAMALFGEKYGDLVRVLKMGEFSIELCGGTHASRTGDIGLFKIVSESGIAAGVRRIEALTGVEAIALLETQEDDLREASELVKATPKTFVSKTRELVEQLKEAEKTLKAIKTQQAMQAADALVDQAVKIGQANVLLANVEGADANALRDMMDKFKAKLNPAVIVLASVPAEGKVALIAGVSDALTSTIKAGDVVKEIAQAVGGKGGGRPDLAQAGGTQPEKLDEALKNMLPWLKSQLS